MKVKISSFSKKLSILMCILALLFTACQKGSDSLPDNPLTDNSKIQNRNSKADSQKPILSPFFKVSGDVKKVKRQ